ncbi:putative Serine/threonine protein kinase with TPR repeats [Candidatus Sulfopaludibacter sp. SbA6]|nr:putative Serine/threonine protein kinase with TPR repeats [Candidatus Sulfopaludibacter sp. SbA6]
MHFNAGTRVGPYEIVASLGAGGMGEVYSARDTRLGRTVALKFLAGEFDAGALARFEREARTASSLNHPNICTIHDVGEFEGRPFLVMECLQGQTLAGPLPAGQLAAIAIQICGALEHAHQRGIVHRDVKPSNIFITSNGHAKVLDFGIAKVAGEAAADKTVTMMTNPGAAVGTLPYMSPEQALGQELDTRSDLFSFGVVLYEMAAGQLPFTGATPAAVYDAILNREPAPLPNAALDAVVRKCLAKDRARRYASAAELRADLERLREPEPRVRARLSRRWAAVAALLVLICAALWYLARQRWAAGRIESIAVLPLESAGQEYLPDAITEAVITRLARIGSVRVVSWAAVKQYKGVERPLDAIMRELNVDGVLHGSIARPADRVRVALQLHKAGKTVWSGAYEREIKDILALQNDIARDVAREIGAHTTAGEQQQLPAAHPVSPEAYDVYLRGRYRVYRENKDDNLQAIQLLERAVALDPNFAPAHADLARAYCMRSFYFDPNDKSLDEKAFIEVEKALSLDRQSAEAHYVRGLMLWRPSNRFPHEAALREYRLALSLNPNLEDAHHQVGQIFFHTGLLDSGLLELRRELEVNPGNTMARFRIGVVLLYQGKYADALDAFRGVAREFSPARWDAETAATLLHLGRREEAAALLETSMRERVDPAGAVDAVAALRHAMEGRPAEAERLLARAEDHRAYGHFHHTAYYMAAAYAVMKRPNEALRWLQSAADEGYPCYPVFQNDELLNPIRGNPEFVAFLEKQRTDWERRKATLTLQ